MISRKTKQVAIVAFVLLATMLVLVVLGVRTIVAKSEDLSVQVAAIEVDQSQQAAFTRLQKLVAETEVERDQVRSYYLASQSDSIDFLNYIEQLAADRGITLETRSPTEVERENKQTYLSVGYVINGSLTQVENFIQLMETIPYVSQLVSVKLQKQSGVLWQADVMIDVAVLTYE
jgi:Tfp pilus assembly protein PilO